MPICIEGEFRMENLENYPVPDFQEVSKNRGTKKYFSSVY